MLSDSAGDVVVERQDSPYGNELYKHGKGELLGLAGSANSSETEVESQLGLIRMGTRFYAPGLGRWISPDALFLESPQKVITNPLQSNLFSYSLNNPVNFNDPSGQEITAENIFAAFSLATQDLSEETGVKIEFVAGTGVEAQAQFYDVGIGTKRSAEVSWDPAERSIKVSGEVTKNVGGGDTGVGGSIAWGHGKVDAELQGILGAAGDVSGTISVDKQTFTGSVKHEKAIVDVATRVGLFKLGASSKVVTEGGPDGGEIAVENSVTLFSVKLTHKKVVVSTKKKKPRRRTMTRVNRSYRGDGSFTGLIADSWFEMLH